MRPHINIYQIATEQQSAFYFGWELEKCNGECNTRRASLNQSDERLSRIQRITHAHQPKREQGRDKKKRKEGRKEGPSELEKMSEVPAATEAYDARRILYVREGRNWNGGRGLSCE